MNVQSIRSEISSTPALKALALEGKTQEIADYLSTNKTKVVSHFASERGILERFPLGPLAADTLLAKLEDFSKTAHPMSRIVGRALKFLALPEGLDIGSPATRGLLVELANAGVITEAEVNGLTQMATIHETINEFDVRLAIYADNGTILV